MLNYWVNLVSGSKVGDFIRETLEWRVNSETLTFGGIYQLQLF